MPDIEILLRSSLTGNETGVNSGLSDESDGISFFTESKKCSVEGRSTGFDLQGLCQTGGYVWKQTDSPGEIPAAVQTTFCEAVNSVYNNVVHHSSIFKLEET